jgi:cobalt transport protein ATP-binding subunit
LEFIEVRGLSYSYPNAKKPALAGVDLSIDREEFILLTGPSGCGKTTLCRTLNGLIPHFYSGSLDGEITVAGMKTREHSTSDLAQHVGLIFQNPDNQIFALTVEKDVAFGLENLGYDREKMIEEIDWAMKQTGIGHLRKRATHELSGGQKQRLAIASILAMRPEVVVLDEPTSFLDPLGAERIFKVMRALNKDYGMTVILVEHRVDLAAQYVDRVIVFDEGRVVNDGPPSEIFMLDDTRLTGIGIPKIVDLYKRLNSRGVDLGGPPISPGEFVSKIEGRLHSSPIELPPRPIMKELDEFVGVHRSNPVIEARDVHFSYPSGVKALKGVTLNIHKGEFVAIMGENGAGKTTLVKHFNGLLRPNSGNILVNGADISKQSVASLAKSVGLVFQNADDQLFSENVREEISFALRNFGFESDAIVKRVDWALNLLDIDRYRDSSPFILSGGERKRVALASVLAWDPDIVVLDEPTIGQDYSQKERLSHILMQLRTQGKTTIIVTHDVEFVAETKPRIVLMADGRVIADGSSKEIMTDSKTLRKASVSPPEITKAFTALSYRGIPRDVLDVDEAVDVLSRLLEVGG